MMEDQIEQFLKAHREELAVASSGNSSLSADSSSDLEEQASIQASAAKMSSKILTDLHPQLEIS